MVRLNAKPRHVKYITYTIKPYELANISTAHTTWVEMGRETLLIPCDAATIARFNHQRGNLSPAEYLDEMLDLADGELPY